MTSVSIVIPAYNEEKYIGRLLASLQKYPHENILEILVVDNGSTDKTREIVRIASLNADGTPQKIRLIEESRKGVAWARNRGAQDAKGDIIVFLDADTYVTQEWLAVLEKYFSSEKNVCVSGPTYYYDLSRVSRIASEMYWWFAVEVVAKITGYMGNFANLAVRAQYLEEIGGINTSVEFYGDDTNISRRLSKVGKVIFARDFHVYASARRFNQQGLVRTTLRYAINFFSEVLVHKPITKGYTEVR